MHGFEGFHHHDLQYRLLQSVKINDRSKYSMVKWNEFYLYKCGSKENSSSDLRHKEDTHGEKDSLWLKPRIYVGMCLKCTALPFCRLQDCKFPGVCWVPVATYFGSASSGALSRHLHSNILKVCSRFAAEQKYWKKMNSLAKWPKLETCISAFCIRAIINIHWLTIILQNQVVFLRPHFVARLRFAGSLRICKLLYCTEFRLLWLGYQLGPSFHTPIFKEISSVSSSKSTKLSRQIAEPKLLIDLTLLNVCPPDCYDSHWQTGLNMA